MQTTQRSRTKVIQVIVHTIAWAMMFCSPLFFSQGEGNSISWARYLGFCASPLAFMLVFYLNYFVLIDRLLFRKRLGTFVLINLLLIILLAVGLHGWHEFHRTYVMGIPPPSRPRARTQFYLFYTKGRIKYLTVKAPVVSRTPQTAVLSGAHTVPCSSPYRHTVFHAGSVF